MLEHFQRPSRSARYIAMLAIGMYGVLLVCVADTRIIPGLDADRYAFMESLVERGVFHVDDASMTSIDRIRVGNHFYPAKPPLLSFAGGGVYWALFHGAGWRFTTHPDAVVRVMIALFVVMPVCVLLWLFWCAAGAHRTKLTLLLAFGSILLPFSIAFTNHPLAAALLFGAFLSLRTTESALPPRSWFLAGMLAGLSAVIDLIPGTVFLVTVFAWAAGTGRRAVAGLVAGAAIPATIHLALNLLTLGTPVPGYLVRGGTAYPGSPWAAPAGPGDEFPSYLAALRHYLVGHRSVLVMEPLLFVGAAGCIAAWRRAGSRRAAMPAAAVLVFAVLLVLVPWFSLRGLGGTVYGPRHLVPAAPLLYWFIPAVATLARRRLARAGLALLVVWSVVINGIGLLDPWCRRDLSVHEPLDVIAGRVALVRGLGIAEWVVDYTAPNASHGHSVLGMKRRMAGQHDEAIASFERALQIEPYRGEALYGLGVVARETGRDALATRMFERLLAQEPDNAWAWAHLGHLRLAADDRNGARDACSRALRIDPGNPEARALEQKGVLQSR